MGAGTVTVNVLQAVENPTSAVHTKVGKKIKWMRFELNFSSETLTNTKIIHWQVVQIPFGLVSTGDPTLYNQDYKAMIMQRGMEMMVKDNSSLVKRIFVISSRLIKRMKLGDIIQLQMKASSTETLNNCGAIISRVET